MTMRIWSRSIGRQYASIIHQKMVCAQEQTANIDWEQVSGQDNLAIAPCRFDDSSATFVTSQISGIAVRNDLVSVEIDPKASTSISNGRSKSSGLLQRDTTQTRVYACAHMCVHTREEPRGRTSQSQATKITSQNANERNVQTMCKRIP